MYDELDLFLITSRITPNKIIAGVVLIIVILIVIGAVVFMRRRGRTSA